MSKELEDLKRRAEQALADYDGHDASLDENDGIDLMDEANAPRVLEELRVYQAELEIQNQQLRDSEYLANREQQRYLTLFDTMPIGALVVDRSAIILEANLYAAELLNFTGPKRLLKHSLFRLFDANSSSWLADQINQLCQQSVTTVNHKLRLKQATDYVSVDCSIARLPSSYGLDNHFLLMLRDLRAEDELDQYHRLVQTLLDNSESLIYVFDENAKCLLANKKTAQLLGTDVDRLIGRSRNDFVDTADSIRHSKNDEEVLKSGKSLITEEEFTDEHGWNYKFLSHKFPLPDSNGRLYAVAGITTDITNLKQIESRLNLAMQVFSRGSEGILIADKHARITYVNQAFEKITGYKQHEVIGQNPHILSSGRHGAVFWETFWTSINNTGQWMGEIWNRRRDGEVYPQWISVSRVDTEAGSDPQFIGVFRDITQQKQNEETIERLAFYDELTGCANRYLLRDRVRQKIVEMQRADKTFALVFIDLDHFKDVNDVYGHAVGDKLLQRVASRLSDHIRETDTLSRIGGDEFVILISDVNQEVLDQKAKLLIELVVSPYTINHTELNISASIGIARFPDHGDDYDTLLKHADIAMYAAKEAGRNTFMYFESQMLEDASTRVTFDTAMRQSLQQEHFSLVYQPQYDLESQKIVAIEALLRWSHPELGNIPPDIFIPIAEQSDLINELGAWVLDEALAALAEWHRQGWTELRMAVNVSARQFWRAGFVNKVIEALDKSGIPAHLLELELTERLAMQDTDKLVSIMSSLHEKGVRLSIDDFGTGYSSLMYLKKLPFHVLKIDRSFVMGLPS
ncbi:MAG: EAL domain-containing protein, partial [Oceanospirillales bacterium]